jgi:uncharacterized protein (UPF0147 family)
MSKNKSVTRNYGILAETVNAQVLAVGKNASAVQVLSEREIGEFRSCITELKQAIDNINIPKNARVAISKQVSELEKESRKSSPDKGRVESLLKTLSSSAQMLSELVSSASVILVPIAKIAALFGFVIG